MVMAWMPPPDGIAMCQGSPIEGDRRGEPSHDRGQLDRHRSRQARVPVHGAADGSVVFRKHLSREKLLDCLARSFSPFARLSQGASWRWRPAPRCTTGDAPSNGSGTRCGCCHRCRSNLSSSGTRTRPPTRRRSPRRRCGRRCGSSPTNPKTSRRGPWSSARVICWSDSGRSSSTRYAAISPSTASSRRGGRLMSANRRPSSTTRAVDCRVSCVNLLASTSSRSPPTTRRSPIWTRRSVRRPRRERRRDVYRRCRGSARSPPWPSKASRHRWRAFAADASAAWLGLVPLQRSTGGKAKLGRTSKMGQRDIRRLLIIGAMAVVRTASRCRAAPGSWLERMLARKRLRS